MHTNTEVQTYIHTHTHKLTDTCIGTDRQTDRQKDRQTDRQTDLLGSLQIQNRSHHPVSALRKVVGWVLLGIKVVTMFLEKLVVVCIVQHLQVFPVLLYTNVAFISYA
jgi:hypothetical protein